MSKPDLTPITDAEIDRYVAISRMLDATMLSFSKRVADGAPIETSRYQLTVDPLRERDYDAARAASGAHVGLANEGVQILGLKPEMLESSPERVLELMHNVLTASAVYAGCSTPLEEFLLALVLDYGSKISITPKWVREDALKEFEDNFESSITDAALLVRRYPQEFKDAVLSNDEYRVFIENSREGEN
jgi:hypothetical protein